MKNIPHRPLLLAAAAALALSGCGQSVEDARAEAYETLNSMEGLSTPQREEYQSQLNTASDNAAVDHILQEAQTTNNEELAQDATASAAAAAKQDLEDALSGVTLVGTSPECKDMTITFNADGTWSGEAGESRDCLKFGYYPTEDDDSFQRAEAWRVNDDGQTVGAYKEADSLSVNAYYAVTIDGDTYTFEIAPYNVRSGSTDGATAGVEGTHTFVVDSSSSASPSPTS
ncbi:GA module-containing protein [Actinomyces wuliandei]|uniref:GA module-containing protein n=1 Tax=Actinomyces wuliandei TaxID=2057743 RepID=UPI00111B0823|nr:GA module-containing protein [Actinomyces wuliandei]